MRNLRSGVAALAAGLAVFCSSAPALCDDGRENDAITDLAVARISLIEAVRIAEGHVGGRATSAELEAEDNQLVFEVEVVGRRNEVIEVTVDAVSGRVLESQPDPQDEHDDHDMDEEDDDDA